MALNGQASELSIIETKLTEPTGIVDEELTQVNEVIAVIEIAPEIIDAAEWVTFEATAYTADCRGCSGITKSGVDVRKTTLHEGKTVIAVDPKVIPLGSEIEIRLADGTIIEGIAVDTGGAIKGMKIDVLHATYDAAVTFGRQAVEVRIINE